MLHTPIDFIHPSVEGCVEEAVHVKCVCACVYERGWLKRNKEEEEEEEER